MRPRSIFSVRAGDTRETTRRVPESDDVNALLLAPQPIDDAIGTADDFAQIGLLEFRHAAANFGEIRQIFSAGDQFITQPDSRIGIVLGNVADNISQIGLR